MSDYRIVKTDELYHHGIKGMKWGVRRYQNEDGSLTKAGRKRYEKAIDRASRKYDKEKAGTYAESVELDKMYKKLGKVGADILKNNENSEEVKSIRAKFKRHKELEDEQWRKVNDAISSKAGQKEIVGTIDYYTKKYGYGYTEDDAISDLINNPKNPYSKTSVIAKTYMRSLDATNAAQKDCENAIESYISKLTGSIDHKYVDRGKTALSRALAMDPYPSRQR